MKESEALFLQVNSDFQAAERVYVGKEDATYCQAIAKYQQTVEKTVKALCAAVEENSDIRFSRYTHNISNLIAALTSPSLVSLGGMSISRQAQIDTLMQLAPGRGTMRRNTEYPFQDVLGRWKAPAESGVFTQAEVDEYTTLANALLADAQSSLATLLSQQ